MAKGTTYGENRNNLERARIEMDAVAYDPWDTARRNNKRVRDYEARTGRSYASIRDNYEKARMAWQEEIGRNDVFAPGFKRR